jgi:hypothetical protein
MDPTSQAAELQELSELIGSANYLFSSRYFAIAGLVAVLYDHILTAPAEIELIWRGKPDLTKVIYFFNRYFVTATLTYAVYVLCVLRPALTDNMCKTYVLYVTTASIVAMAVANFTITMRIQAIWDHRKHITYAVIGAFLLTYSVTVVFAGFVIRDLHEHVVYEPLVAKTCIVLKKPSTIPGVWAGMVGFDIFVFVLVLLNSVNRPYRQNTDVISALHKDGLMFFLALLGIRLINLVLSIVTGAVGTFLIVFFVWAMVSITLSRLLLRIETLRLGGQSVHVWKGDVFELTEYE